MERALTDPVALFDVSGQVVVITGASGALGRAVAIALGSVGAKLVLVSGSADALEAVAGEVREVGADPVTLVRRPDSVGDAETILAAGIEAFGRVDSVFVGSGYNKPAQIVDMDHEDWQDVMDANVRGPWVMAKALGTHLIG